MDEGVVRAHDVGDVIVNAFDRVDVSFGRNIFDGEVSGSRGIEEALVVELAAGVAANGDQRSTTGAEFGGHRLDFANHVCLTGDKSSKYGVGRTKSEVSDVAGTADSGWIERALDVSTSTMEPGGAG